MVVYRRSIILLFVFLGSLSCICALPSNGTPRDSVKFILGEENIGPWKNDVSEAAAAPGPSPDGSTSTLLLAANRTKRPDILHGFRRYLGGWDINNRHYWASVGFTGAAAFILAVLWFFTFGFVLAMYHCCGWRINITNKGAKYSQRICLMMLILFTCAAAIGCILLSVGQNKFHSEVLHTLNYVVNQSDYTVQTLKNVTEYLSLSKNISVAQIFITPDDMDNIDKLNIDLNNAADTIMAKTSENDARIKHVFGVVRLALITVAAVMLLLSLIGLLLSVLGHQHAIHIFVLSGWILVAVTFILCGVFVIFNNAISDTCMAMEQWVENPKAETALSDILPCVDQATTNHTLTQSKKVINSIVNVVNIYIYSYANPDPSKDDPTRYYNQSGPPMPPLCLPFDSQLQDRECASQEVPMANASLVWKDYVCAVSALGQCVTVGRIRPDTYNQLVAAVNQSYALEHYTPPLLGFQDCNFVREAFQTITADHCPPLEHHLKLVNAGLGLISVGVLLCLVLWILYANRPQREEVFVKLPLPIKCWSKKNDRSKNSDESALSNLATGV